MSQLGLMISRLAEVSELSLIKSVVIGIVRWKHGDVWIYEHISGKGKHGKETIYLKSGDVINRFWRSGDLIARKDVTKKEAFFTKTGEDLMRKDVDWKTLVELLPE